VVLVQKLQGAFIMDSICVCWATDAKPMPKPDFVEGIAMTRRGLWKWFQEWMCLMSAAPLTKETKEMFNDQAFSKMKPSSYFIKCVSRAGWLNRMR
jgi:phosphoglycerate dehydrogenase-like enzyme